MESTIQSRNIKPFTVLKTNANTMFYLAINRTNFRFVWDMLHTHSISVAVSQWRWNKMKWYGTPQPFQNTIPFILFVSMNIAVRVLICFLSPRLSLSLSRAHTLSVSLAEKHHCVARTHCIRTCGIVFFCDGLMLLPLLCKIIS